MRSVEVLGKTVCMLPEHQNPIPEATLVPRTKSRQVMRFSAVILFFALVFAGCDSSTSSDDSALLFRIDMDVDGLAPLQDAYRYQVWAVVDGAFVGSDEFNISDNGLFVNIGGQIISRTLTFDANIAGATEMFVVVNGKTDSSEFPSSTVLMGGDVSGRSVTFSMSHERAFGPGMSAAGGQFVLTTPTDLDAGNELSGVWFGTPGTSGLQPALQLPLPGTGWTYESWVTLANGTVLSMGKFTDVSAADAGNPYAFPDEVSQHPSMPGEDFLLNAPDGVNFPADLSGAAVFVTVELVVDDVENAPSGIRLLDGTVPAAPSTLAPYAMNASGQLPGGSGSLN